MRDRHWALWVEWTTKRRSAGPRKIRYWAQWCRSDTAFSSGVLAGIAVHRFTGRLPYASQETRIWAGWCNRCISAWNLCLDVADLLEMRPDTPAGILADALSDYEACPELEKALRSQFLLGVKEYRGTGVPTVVPDMPAIPEEKGAIMY